MVSVQEILSLDQVLMSSLKCRNAYPFSDKCTEVCYSREPFAQALSKPALRLTCFGRQFLIQMSGGLWPELSGVARRTSPLE